MLFYVMKFYYNYCSKVIFVISFDYYLFFIFQTNLGPDIWDFAENLDGPEVPGIYICQHLIISVSYLITFFNFTFYQLRFCLQILIFLNHRLNWWSYACILFNINFFFKLL